MTRLLGLLTAAFLLLGLAAPVALAADPGADHGSLLLAVGRDVDLASGEQTDAVVVVDGDAHVSGTARTVVVIRGDAVLTGASVEAVVVVSGDATIGAGSRVSGDVRTLDGSATVDPSATVGGTVADLGSDVQTFAWVLVPFLFLFVLGIGLVTIVGALAVAALGARQVRSAERLISGQPVATIGFGLLGLIVLPVVAIALMLTIVGAPLGLLLLIVVLPAVAWFGWVVAAIWIGDWLLNRGRALDPESRPYAAAVVGVVVLWILGIVPVVGAIATPIASLFGVGAALLLAWRTLRREPVPAAAPPPAPSPTAA